MVKRCIMIFRLIKEADLEKTAQLQKEILEEVQLLLYRIPWVAEIEMVKVSQE